MCRDCNAINQRQQECIRVIEQSGRIKINGERAQWQLFQKRDADIFHIHHRACRNVSYMLRIDRPQWKFSHVNYNGPDSSSSLRPNTPIFWIIPAFPTWWLDSSMLFCQDICGKSVWKYASSEADFFNNFNSGKHQIKYVCAHSAQHLPTHIFKK